MKRFTHETHYGPNTCVELDLTYAIWEMGEAILVGTDGREVDVDDDTAEALTLTYETLPVIGFEIAGNTVRIKVDRTGDEIIRSRDSYFAMLDRDFNGWR